MEWVGSERDETVCRIGRVLGDDSAHLRTALGEAWHLLAVDLASASGRPKWNALLCGVRPDSGKVMISGIRKQDRRHLPVGSCIWVISS